MRLRLVAPTKRKDSSNRQFEQRIPADLNGRLVGMRLEFPLAGEVVPVTITSNMRSIRFSLRTGDASEVRQRQAEAVAYLEGVYRNLRANVPIALTHRQQMAVAADHARAFLAKHEDEPFDAPPLTAASTLPQDGDKAWFSAFQRMDRGKREAVVADLA